jgi:excinuclease ABC subunit A
VFLDEPRAHNLKGGEARFLIGGMTSVAGVSGSGKSTLVFDLLARIARRHLGGGGPRPGPFGGITGLDAIERLVVVDQSPIGRSPRSTAATYTGLHDAIRRLFAQMRESKLRGFKPSRFSFNVKGGRCEACQGQGVRRIPMTFLPDLYQTCETCRGRRYSAATLEVRFRGLSIADVMDLRVDAALGVFEAQPLVLRGVQALHEAGLGYLTLGQPSTTLSGGEAQRVKLAAELGQPASLKTLFLLDEPTTGLHFADIANLLGVLERLAAQGHTLVVIEHNLDVIRASDWVIDLGPGGGEAGGQILAQGTPAELAANPRSVTGAYLE